jgi:hypothetical protein
MGVFPTVGTLQFDLEEQYLFYSVLCRLGEPLSTSHWRVFACSILPLPLVSDWPSCRWCWWLVLLGLTLFPEVVSSTQVAMHISHGVL